MSSSEEAAAATRAAAAAELERIFSTFSDPHHEEDLVNRALDLLTAYPEFVKESLSGSTPFRHFIRLPGVTLSQIKQVENLLKLSSSYFVDKKSMYQACKYCDNAEVIGYLAERDEFGYIAMLFTPPIHLLLARSRDFHPEQVLQMIQCFQRRDPGILLAPSLDGSTPLSQAVAFGQDGIVIDYLMDLSCPDEAVIGTRVHDGEGEGVAVGVEAVIQLQKWMPHLKRLKIQHHEWTPRGFQFLLSVLEENHSIEQLDLLIPAFSVPDEFNNQGIQRLLECKDTCLRQVKFETLEQGHSMGVLESIRDGFCSKKNTSIQVLTLAGPYQQTKGIDLIHLLLHGPPFVDLKDVALDFDEISSPEELGDANPATTSISIIEQIPAEIAVLASASRLATLKLSHCLMSTASFWMLMSSLVHFSSLRSLDLEYRQERDVEPHHVVQQFRKLDITPIILSILRLGVLQELNLKGIGILDMDAICEALRHNSSLTTLGYTSCYRSLDECLMFRSIEEAQKNSWKLHDLLFDVVKNDNATLKKIVSHVSFEGAPPWRPSPLHVHMQLYLEMNRFGRGRLRRANATKDDFIQVVSEAIATKKRQALPFADEIKTVLFLFLLEFPHLWCVIQDVTAE